MPTPREELEQEVKIVARTGKQINFLGKPAKIVGIPWEVIENIGEHIVLIFSPIFELAVSSVSAGGSAPGAGLSDVQAISAFDPAMFTKIGANAKLAIQDLVTYGTDLEWDDVKSADFANVIELAVEVLKFNMGPSLTKNLQTGISETLRAFGVNLMPAGPTTISKPSSSNGDTGKKKSGG